MPPRAAQDDKGTAAIGEELGRQCVSPFRAGAHHFTVNGIAAALVIVNVHPLPSKRDALHHGHIAYIKEIDTPGSDDARL